LEEASLSVSKTDTQAQKRVLGMEAECGRLQAELERVQSTLTTERNELMRQLQEERLERERIS
jgi:hypothetical protein